jgi:hypothetical protein
MALSNPIIAGALQFLGGTANAYKEERDKRAAVANKKQMMGMEQQNKLDTLSHEQMLRQEEATRTSNTPTAKANERKAIAEAAYAENRVGEPVKALQKRVEELEKAEAEAERKKKEAEDKIKAAREQKEYEKQYDETVRALSDRLEAYRNGDPSEDMDTLRKFVKKHRTTLQGEHNQIPFPDAKKIADGEIIERNISVEDWEAKQAADRALGEGQFQFGAQNMRRKAPLGQDAPATPPAGDVSAIEGVLGADQPAPPSMGSETVPLRPTTPVGMGAEASTDIPSPESFGGPEELDLDGMGAEPEPLEPMGPAIPDGVVGIDKYKKTADDILGFLRRQTKKDFDSDDAKRRWMQAQIDSAIEVLKLPRKSEEEKRASQKIIEAIKVEFGEYIAESV